mgnify:CR=1 FL=1
MESTYRITRTALASVVLLAILMSMSGVAYAAEQGDAKVLPAVDVTLISPTDTKHEKLLHVGDSEIMKFLLGVTRIVVGDPSVADVAVLSSTEVLVNAKSPGSTILYIWEGRQRKDYQITVPIASQVDMVSLCAQIEGEIAASGGPAIMVRAVGNTIFLEGRVAQEADSKRAQSIAEALVTNVVYRGVSVSGRISSGGSLSTASSPVPSAAPVAAPAGGALPAGSPASAPAPTPAPQMGQTREAPVVQLGLRVPEIVNLIQVSPTDEELLMITQDNAERMARAIDNPFVKVEAAPAGLIKITGRVPNKGEAEKLTKLISGLQASLGVNAVAAIDIDTSLARQVMVKAQVIEIDKRDLEDFGIDWGRMRYEGEGVTFEDQPFLFGQIEIPPTAPFEAGRIVQFTPFGARVRALVQQNKAKVLSEPNLMVLDGEQGSILVGGEVAIPIIETGGGGNAAVTIEFKEFGIKLAVQPMISRDGETVHMRVAPEVSTLDFANAIILDGFQIPALRSRKAETTVNMRDGESLVIGGLVHEEVSRAIKKIPVLGDLPILGEFFKTRSFTNTKNELVIVITPQILRPNVKA